MDPPPPAPGDNQTTHKDNLLHRSPSPLPTLTPLTRPPPPLPFSEANGMQVVKVADWTHRLRGFWDLGAAEVLLWRDPEAEKRYYQRSFLANLLVFILGVSVGLSHGFGLREGVGGGGPR